MAPWNHSIAALGFRCSLEVLSSRSRSWPRPLLRRTPRPGEPQLARLPPPAPQERANSSAASWDARKRAGGARTSREATRRGRHGAPLPRLLRKLVRARAREALGADVEGRRGKGDETAAARRRRVREARRELWFPRLVLLLWKKGLVSGTAEWAAVGAGSQAIKGRRERGADSLTRRSYASPGDRKRGGNRPHEWSPQ